MICKGPPEDKNMKKSNRLPVTVRTAISCIRLTSPGMVPDMKKLLYKISSSIWASPLVAGAAPSAFPVLAAEPSK